MPNSLTPTDVGASSSSVMSATPETASRSLLTGTEIDRISVLTLPAFVTELATVLLRVAVRLGKERPVAEAPPSLDMDPDRLLDVRAAAEFLGLPKSYLAELGRRGRIARVAHGKYVRFRLGDLRQWIMEHREPGVVEGEYGPIAKRAKSAWPLSPEELLTSTTRRRPRRAGGI